IDQLTPSLNIECIVLLRTFDFQELYFAILCVLSLWPLRFILSRAEVLTAKNRRVFRKKH
ncbi:MAG TPA: hypothetical protein PKJ94_14505, partial [Ferruginibacter sp.]|nr:hypothetical protein [Ferruginibacter sp.]